VGKNQPQNESMNTMTKHNAVVAIYQSHNEAEAAIKQLQESGFDLKQLSIVGRDYHTDKKVAGCDNAGSSTKYGGKTGAFWGGIWGLFVAGVGPLLIGGPLVTSILGALQGTSLVGGLSAMGAGFYSLGIPKNRVLQYETAVKTGKYVLIAQGTPEETAQAQHTISKSSPEAVEHHPPAAAKMEPVSSRPDRKNFALASGNATAA
jgi:uncharacterized membrane protein